MYDERKDKMKKTIIALAVIALVAPLAFGQEVLSRNAVGYVKVTAPKGYTLASMDFESMGGGSTPADIIGDQLPDGSSVIFWDPGAQQYVGELKTRSGWINPGTNEISFARAMFLRVPATAVSNEYQVYLMGEVPAATGQTHAVNGFYFQAYPYPVSVLWTNTDMSKQAADGSSVILWDTTTQAYVGSLKSRSGWNAPGPSMVLNPGQGFILRATAPLTVNETKPYTWPAE